MTKTLKHALGERNFCKVVRCIKSLLPPSITGNLVFFKNHHRFINYKTPQLLDEKLLILRGGVYRNNKLISQCADKFAVRDYIRSCSPEMEKYLINLYGVYSRAEDIDWSRLPNKFVAKCNHGSGYNIVVKDKSKVDRGKLCKRLDYWLDENYGIISSEMQYKRIVPKIVIETFIEGMQEALPIDYKFFASRGEVICCLVVIGRGVKVERIFVDAKFNDLNLFNGYTGSDYHMLKPDSYDEMIEAAEKLSKKFPFVRVDLYDTDGKIFFGELTFTPNGCIHDYLSDEAQRWIGKKIRM